MRILKVMARAYARPEGMDALIAFYERLTGERCQFRLTLPALGLEIASVGSVHLLAGPDENLAPFRAAHATFFVDSVAQFAEELARMSAETIRSREVGTAGSFMIVRHPDGLVVEYIDQSGK